MRRAQNLLFDAIAHHDVLRAARALRVLRKWDEIVGEAMATRSWPDRFDHGTLWVAVSGSAWAQELRMMKDRILVTLNESCGEGEIFKDVRFGVRPLQRSYAPVEYFEAPERPSAEGLSIREIAERRMKSWEKPEPCDEN